MPHEQQTLTLVEPGGRGGVFQHALAVGVALAKQLDHVRLITAVDAEIEDDRLEIVRVLDWHRSEAGRHRQSRIVLSFLTKLFPTVARSPGDVWVQGSFKPALTLLLLVFLRLKRVRVLYSPHTLFSRHGGKIERLLFDLCIRLAETVIVYNESDLLVLRERGLDAHLVPLEMYVPPLRVDRVRVWQRYASEHGITVCSVGQLRKDKNLPMLIRAGALAQTRVLIAGEDAGALADIVDQSRRHPDSVRLMAHYLDMDDLAAILYSVGLVALPYSVASQSAVAVLARAYGALVLAYNVGGLETQSDFVISSLDEEDWATAIKQIGDRRNLSHVLPPLPAPDPVTVRALAKLFA